VFANVFFQDDSGFFASLPSLVGEIADLPVCVLAQYADPFIQECDGPAIFREERVVLVEKPTLFRTGGSF
jgi:hypothetical protein